MYNMKQHMLEFDTELFIAEIKARPAIWNTKSVEYFVKSGKEQAWEEVCSIMVPDFEDRTEADRVNKCKLIQRKWRNLRDCFSRDFNARIQRTGNRSENKYMYYNQLSFLSNIVEKKKRDLSLDAEHEDEFSKQVAGYTDNGIDNKTVVEQDEGKLFEDKPLQEITPLSETYLSPTPVASQPISPRRHQEEATELKTCNDTQERLFSVSFDRRGLDRDNEDEDYLFLMSLFKDIKKIHEDDKLEFKSEMLLLIRKWQKVQQVKDSSSSTKSVRCYSGGRRSQRCTNTSTSQALVQSSEVETLVHQSNNTSSESSLLFKALNEI